MMESTEVLLPRVSPENSRSSSPKCRFSCRYSLAILAGLGFGVVYALRVNLSVALVAMVNSTNNKANVDLHNPNCEGKHLCNTTSTASKNGEFNWDEKTQGIILGAFFYGYIVTQIPGGWIASKYGGKHIFGLGVLSTAVLTLLTPLAAHHSVGALIALRVLEGLGEGVTFPAIHVMWSSWAPPLERSRLTAISFAGCGLGNIISQPISGILCESGFLGGWPSVFYVFGCFGILWYILWIVLAYEKPVNHPRITEEEKEYILSSIGSSQDKVLKQHSVPWLAIVTSPAVCAITISFICTNWGYYTFLTSLPTYFKDVLGFKILEDGFISSIPYICSVISQLGAAVFGDWLMSNGISSVTDVRKTFSTCSFLVPACLLISVSYVGSDGKVLAVVLISAILAFGSFSSAGYGVNQQDIAPRYAGIITGYANCIGTIPGFVAPFLTGLITNGNPTRHQWQKVFYITAIIYVIGAVGFILLGKGEEQSWNTPNDEILVQVDTEQEQRKTSLPPNETHYGSVTPSINTM